MPKLINHKLLLLLGSMLLASAMNAQQPNGNNLEISILTCDYGHDFATTFGHVAIRVNDKVNQRDIVFDYGTFTFNEPHFVLRFMRGDLLYYLSIRDFDRFNRDYTYENRTVTEQKLNLTPEQKIRIFRALAINYHPDNRYYKYDFVADNCATRIRDIFAHPDFAHPEHITDSTFRKYLSHYLDSKKWLQFGIDILLGQDMDKKASFAGAMYLPYTISHNFTQYTNIINNKPLAGEPVTIIQGETKNHRFDPLQPLIILVILLALAGWLIYKNSKLLNKIAPAIYTVLTAIGIIVLFMWFGSRYPCTKLNWNLLWTLPVYPLLLLPIGGRAKIAIHALAAALAGLVLLLGWWAIPQHFNPATYLAVALIIMLNVNDIQIRRSAKVKR